MNKIMNKGEDLPTVKDALTATVVYTSRSKAVVLVYFFLCVSLCLFYQEFLGLSYSHVFFPVLFSIVITSIGEERAGL